MFETYYCSNIKCEFGIGITEVLKTGERCPKCGTQPRKLAFADMMKLVEEKKTYKNRVASLPEENMDTKSVVESIVSPIPVDNPTPIVSKEEFSEEIQEEIPEDVESYEKSIQSISKQPNMYTTDEKLEALIYGYKALIEQNKIMIQQNELILKSLVKIEETNT